MRELFEDRHGVESALILKEYALTPAYYSTDVLHREAELKEIAEAVKPLLYGRQPENLFIHGDSGTGKTTCAKYVSRKLEEQSGNVKPVYINCWQSLTRMSAYSKIALAIETMLPRRGWAIDEGLDRITEAMEKENVRVLMVLDELDGLFFQHQEWLLYDLTRINSEKPLFCVLAISKDKNLLANKDIRIKSSVRLKDLEFKHYNAAQIADILEERAKISLRDGSYNRNVLDACAARAFARESNARLGFEFLWRAAKIAERGNRSKITLEDVKASAERTLYDEKAPKRVEDLGFEFMNASLTDEERLILSILKNGEKTSSQLYAAFCRKMTRSSRSIRNYLSRLEIKQLVRIETVPDNGSGFSTRKIRLNIGVGNET